MARLGLVSLLVSPLPALSSPDDPAGNGYHSSKVRLPKWHPTYDMKRSTILMPCNDSGWHRVDEALRYGLVSYDWANAHELWMQGSPVDDETKLTAQADLVVAADPSGSTRVGVYRNAIKAFNWFGQLVQKKLDDPQYAGWFIPYKDCQGQNVNPPCTGSKCSCAWHDHAGQLDGGTQDCGKSPCGGYVFDHRNESFSEWFIHEFIISDHTILRKGISEMYLDDRVELSGIAEADPHFLQDTGLSRVEMQALKDAFESNMEKVYGMIIEQGAFAWQMLYAGPFVLPQYFYNGTLVPSGGLQPEVCAERLRAYCKPDGYGAQRAIAYTNNVHPDDARVRADQCLSVFLLTRGDYAWIGFDYRGCKSDPYPRPALWDEDYGEPLAVCFETNPNSMIFQREWTKATVMWDCRTGWGDIAMKPSGDVAV